MKVIIAQSGLGRGFSQSSGDRGDETSDARTDKRVPNPTAHTSTQQDVNANPNTIE